MMEDDTDNLNTHSKEMEHFFDMHKDLARKYQLHGPKIESLWRSFSPPQRLEALSMDHFGYKLLRCPQGCTNTLHKILPEWNPRELASGPDFLLDLLKHRATKTPLDQYMRGVNGGPGDHKFILDSIRYNGLQTGDACTCCVALFYENSYGTALSLELIAKNEEMVTIVATGTEGGVCVSKPVARKILERQENWYAALNNLVGNILKLGSSSRSTKTDSKKPEETARAALSKLSIVQKPEKPSLQDVLASALDQKTALNDYMRLCCSEPVLLTSAVNAWFGSMPERVQDTRGQAAVFLTDKYIGISIFDVIHNVLVGAAIWDYLHRLLHLLSSELKSKISKSIILQEVANVCHLEFSRAKALFKRHVQSGSGKKNFKRIPDVYDEGTARVLLKSNPELLTKENPQLHYMLRLCSPDTDASRAVVWVKNLDDLHHSHPAERDRMWKREFESFSDLAVITSFIQSLSACLPMPPTNVKKHIFGSRFKNLSAELQPLKILVDLSKFSNPIDQLMEPGMAEGALDALDRFIVEKMGTKMGCLFSDLVDECMTQIQDCCRQSKTKANELPALQQFNDTSSQEIRIQQRRQKDKTRPAHSSAYDITAQTTEPTELETLEDAPVFRVKKDTFDVFATMFSKSASRGSVNWVAFEEAMVDLSFSVMPKEGSVFTFFPPPKMGLQKSITLHRPHKSEIEGYSLLYFARRLNRVYGWGGQSFEIS